ncbi:hypothetical protein C0993_000812 [Termitomyces sp. T159_Od127]|nr:hypothetical protein C0993_000812 [Termitomyces sp. T159_Od127]
MDVVSTATRGESTDGIPSASLKTWFQTKLESLYEVPSHPDSEHSPHLSVALFTSRTQILLNHIPITFEDFQNDIRSQLQSSIHASVSWKDVMEVYNPEDESQKQEGIVAGIYVVTRSLKFRIRAGPAQRKTTVVFSAKIERDPNIHDEDARRVVHLHQTQLDEAVPIIIHGIGSQQTTS